MRPTDRWRSEATLFTVLQVIEFQLIFRLDWLTRIRRKRRERVYSSRINRWGDWAVKFDSKHYEAVRREEDFIHLLDRKGSGAKAVSPRLRGELVQQRDQEGEERCNETDRGRITHKESFNTFSSSQPIYRVRSVVLSHSSFFSSSLSYLLTEWLNNEP